MAHNLLNRLHAISGGVTCLIVFLFTHSVIHSLTDELTLFWVGRPSTYLPIYLSMFYNAQPHLLTHSLLWLNNNCTSLTISLRLSTYLPRHAIKCSLSCLTSINSLSVSPFVPFCFLKRDG